MDFHSDQKTAVDPYVPMYSTATRGQEDVGLLSIACEMNEYEGNKKKQRKKNKYTCYCIQICIDFVFLQTSAEMYEKEDDETDDLQALTFDDLLSFAFQVAKGMEFLSSKNVRDNRDISVPHLVYSQTKMLIFNVSSKTNCISLIHKHTVVCSICV